MKTRQLLSLALFALGWTAGSSAWAHDGDHTYTNGVCTIDGCTDKYQPAELVDGKFQLKNAGNIEWMGVKIANGEQYSGKNYNQATYEMQNDIDFTDVTHTPIGPNDGKKFNGVFDGKGHKISNMKVEATNVGMFCWLRGGTTIKNLTLDATCSFKGTDRAGSFACVTQVRGGGDVNLINCVNYASVTSQNKIASGLIAACNWNNDDEPTLNIINCVNAGNVTCTGSDNTVAFYGWSKSAGGTKVNIINSYNTGTLNKVDGGKRNLVRASNMANVTITNSFDLTTAAANCGQGAKTWNTGAPLTSGELCYTLNLNVDSRAYTFKQTLEEDAMPLPKESGSIVYQAGEVNCKNEAVGSVTYNNESGETVVLPHDYDNGICSLCHGFEEPKLVDGYYQLANAGNVEWLSAQVAKNGGSTVYNAKLTNDIDFKNIENLHSPIGPNTGQKYKGTFDGQGYRIMNMIINRPSDNNIGFFGFLQGNATTKVCNLTIDASCSISANNRVGGLTGSYQNSDGTITIENVVVAANVSAKGQDAGGFLGGHESGNPTITIKNCVNAGSVSSTHGDAFVGALCCYMGVSNESSIENFINIGSIGTHKGGNIGRHNIGKVTNLIDLSDTDDKNEGTVAGLSFEDIASGKLAYYINSNDNQAEDAFYQNLTGEVDAYPVPFNTSAVVYQNGTLNCDGSPKEITYSNTNTGIIRDEHNNVHDICSVCGTSNATINKDGEGFYQIANAAELAKFAQTVNVGEANAKGLLTADIDASADPYTVIGLSTVPFVGTIDGQGHSVTLGINNNKDYQGFVGYANGGAVIKNLVVKGGVQAGSHIGGVIGEAKGSGTITITNVGNEANVSGQNEVAGIIGNNWGGSVGFNITNVYNTGDITIGGTDGATIATYMANSTLTNVYNTGSVTGNINGQGNFVRQNGCTYVNCYNTLDGDSENAGKKAIETSVVASGELCFKLGGAFRQNLTGEVDTYPVLDGSHAQVYANGTFKCDHETPISIAYENTDKGTVYQDHVLKANGFCENCTLNPVESLSKDGDGYYLISNAAELEKFSDMVEVGGQSADNKAKLTADIDMTGVTHKPIGGGANDSNKFNSVFDGQNHTISHLTALTRNDNTGLFSWVRGSSTIKNLIIDETCEFRGVNHVAAFVGKTQAGDNVRFENCINRGHVICTNNHAAAFVGKSEGPKTNMINCGNAGTIESALNACALVSWFRGGTIKNCWNIGEIVKGDWDKTNGADYDKEVKVSTLNLFNGNAAYPTSLINTFDASASAERSQGTLLDASAAASGELTYKIGGDWRQEIGTDAHPVLSNSKPVVETFSISSVGYATYSYGKNFVMPTGVEGQIVKVEDDKYVTVTAYEAGDIVPAATGLLLKADEGAYYFNPTTADATITPEGSLLHAAVEAKTTDGGAPGAKYYKLANGSRGLGWYYGSASNTTGEAFAIGANKAYLVIEAGAEARAFISIFGDENETGIANVATESAPAVIYNLAGQRIQKMQKGVNVVNGKKVMF